MKKLVYITALILFLYVVFVAYGKITGNGVNLVNNFKEVNVYSSRKEVLMHDLFDKFTESTGIKVNFVIDKAPKLIARLYNEGDNSLADLFLTSDVANLQKAKELRLLKKVSSSILEKNIPKNYREEDGYWFGLSRRIRAVFYAKSRVDESDLSTYEDLASGKWRGKILIRSSGNVYNQSLLASLIEVNGEKSAQKWVNGLVENFARKPQGGDTDQLRALAAGEGDIAIANSYYYGRLQASDKDKDKKVVEEVAIFFPNQKGRGAHVNISGGGVTASAKNTKNAIKLLEFLSSAEAQEVYVQRNHELPVKEGVAVSDIIKSWGEFKTDDENLLKFPKHITPAIKMSDKGGWR